MRHPHRRHSILAAAVTLAVIAPLTACGANSGASAGFSPSMRPNGTPDLHGATIRIAVGAAPAIEDTRIPLIAKILKGWGAKTKIVNQTGDPAAVRVVLSGDADVASITASSAINSGLKVFGPSQPRLDYHFMGAPSLKSIKDLPGHIYGTSNPHGVEALMFADMLKKNNIPASKVKVTIAGGASVRVSAMLTHHIDATFVHASDVPRLLKAGFNDLAKMSDAAPELSDSFLVGTSRWTKANPALAMAVDLAWIKAAQIFNDNENQWVTTAVAYGGGSKSEAAQLYAAFKAADTFPVKKSTFTAASARSQEQLAKNVGAINKTPPLSAWFDAGPWNRATATLKIT
jgi:ABC-type nitrate/sulfonate/bicarbonate transport system substrate-binding protein